MALEGQSSMGDTTSFSHRVGLWIPSHDLGSPQHPPWSATEWHMVLRAGAFPRPSRQCLLRSTSRQTDLRRRTDSTLHDHTRGDRCSRSLHQGIRGTICLPAPPRCLSCGLSFTTLGLYS